MKLLYYKVNPTGNITLIVETPVPRESQSAAAAALMAADKTAEQVGFIEQPSLPGSALRLQMMGGEFCGNAALSAGALARLLSLPETDGDSIRLEISGAAEPLEVEVFHESGRLYTGTVDMPLPRSCFTALLTDGDREFQLPVVRFPGISHVIINSRSIEKYGFKVRNAEARIESWCRQLGVEALGMMFWDEADGLLNPFVYVSGTNTAVWESSCASGSTAVAVYSALSEGRSTELNLRQPGGVLTVAAEFSHGAVTGLKLTGTADITAKYSVTVAG